MRTMLAPFLIVTLIVSLPVGATGQVTVEVLSEPPSSTPLAGVRVCLASWENPSQYVLRETGDAGPNLGIAVFEGDPPGSGVPPGGHRYVVSKAGYVGRAAIWSISDPAESFTVRLEEGQGGPICARPMVLTDLRIDWGAEVTSSGDVELFWSTSATFGADVEYRVAETQDFQGATWKDPPSALSAFTPSYLVTHTLDPGLRGNRTVYLQARLKDDPQNQSQVVQDSISFMPPQSASRSSRLMMARRARATRK